MVRQVKYLRNFIEEDHRAIKRVTWLMLNFKSFQAVGSVLASFELIHMIRKDQFAATGAAAVVCRAIYALARQVRPA